MESLEAIEAEFLGIFEALEAKRTAKIEKAAAKRLTKRASKEKAIVNRVSSNKQTLVKMGSGPKFVMTPEFLAGSVVEKTEAYEAYNSMVQSLKAYRKANGYVPAYEAVAFQMFNEAHGQIIKARYATVVSMPFAMYKDGSKTAIVRSA